MKGRCVAFAVVIIVSFAVLGWTGMRIYQEAPRVPAEVVTPDQQVVLRGEEIQSNWPHEPLIGSKG